VPAVPGIDGRMAAAFDAPTALDGLLRLRDRVAAPRALRAYGLRPVDIPAAVDALVTAVPPDNPVRVTAQDLHALLQAALDGADPTPAGT